MKTLQLFLLLVATASSGMAAAQSSQPPQQSNAQVRNVSTEVRIRDSTISAREGEAGASLLARGAFARTRSASVVVGEVRACGNSRIENASTRVDVSRSTITATGDVRIGNITAGCE